MDYPEVAELSSPLLPFDIKVLNVSPWWTAMTEGDRFLDFVSLSFKERFDAPIG